MEIKEEIESNWVIEFKNDIQKANSPENKEHLQWAKRSIYKLPANYYTTQNKNAYQPQVVSIGPYHNGEAHLMPMEEHKRRALANFFKKSNKPIEEIAESLREIAQELRESYHPLNPKWEDDDKFLPMMLLDGCFVLEILNCALVNKLDEGYAENDPIFSWHGRIFIMENILSDIVMLENQLPMLLLYKLCALAQDKDEEFVNRIIHRCWGSTNNLKSEKCLHILDAIRKILISGKNKHTFVERLYLNVPLLFRSASELAEAGIRFKKSKTDIINDIAFNENGILTLPEIWLNDYKESEFLNMTAFERLHVDAGCEVSSYLWFMGIVVRSEKDVALLRHSGIIQNALAGDDKAVADMFNSLSKEANIDPISPLIKVYESVNFYCNRRMSRLRAVFYHTYGKSPLTVIAACVLFTLSVIQTLYAIFAYHLPEAQRKN